MIRQTPCVKCFGCGKRATREVEIGGRPTPFCGRCPSPAEIQTRAAAIRSTWTSIEYYARWWTCNQQQAAENLGRWEFPRAIEVTDGMVRRSWDD